MDMFYGVVMCWLEIRILYVMGKGCFWFILSQHNRIMPFMQNDNYFRPSFVGFFLYPVFINTKGSSWVFFFFIWQADIKS
jgi:hypothetical protein